MSRAAKKLRRRNARARRARAARVPAMASFTDLGGEVFHVLTEMPRPGEYRVDHDENCPTCRTLAGLPPVPDKRAERFTPAALASARARIIGWQPKPGDGPRLEVERIHYDRVQECAGSLRALLPGWEEHVIRMLDWPHTIAAELASTARAEGDEAAAEVLDTLNIGGVSFEAIMTSPTVH